MWIKDLIDALRSIAREPGAANVGLRAGQHVREFLDQFVGNPQVGIDKITEAIRAEAEAHPSEKDFWEAVEEYGVLPHRLRPWLSISRSAQRSRSGHLLQMMQSSDMVAL